MYGEKFSFHRNISDIFISNQNSWHEIIPPDDGKSDCVESSDDQSSACDESESSEDESSSIPSNHPSFSSKSSFTSHI